MGQKIKKLNDDDPRTRLIMGDFVDVELDGGEIQKFEVCDSPWKLGCHTWVLGIKNENKRDRCYALDRVRKIYTKGE